MNNALATSLSVRVCLHCTD